MTSVEISRASGCPAQTRGRTVRNISIAAVGPVGSTRARAPRPKACRTSSGASPVSTTLGIPGPDHPARSVRDDEFSPTGQVR